MLFGPENLLRIVSQNVKEGRAARKWSQIELAERSQVSRGMIIKIESGEENVSLATLGKIAVAFGISFTDLVMDASLEEAAGSGLPEHRPQVWQGACPGTRVALLGSFVRPRILDIFEWTLAPGDRYDGEPDLKNSKEMVYIVKGTMILEHEKGTRNLKAGSSITFPSDRPYAFVNGGKSTLRFILSVVGANPPTGQTEARGMGFLHHSLQDPT
jgi:transcriptional regulator with XRE-family HTH domain